MMRRTLLILILIFSNFTSYSYGDPTKQQNITNLDLEPRWTWICRRDRCERLRPTESSVLQSLPTCNMLCSHSTQLWPQPTGHVSRSAVALPVRADGFTLNIIASPSEDVSLHLMDAFSLMREDFIKLERANPDKKIKDLGNPRPVTVGVTVDGSTDPRLLLSTDESYSMSLRPVDNTLVADISAHSFCGARHGLETLSQLVWMDPYAGSLLILEEATVKDAPKFKYRGLLLDTARNYFPVSEIMRTIDAMGACKLNTFHWHVSDSQSFPLKLNSAPQLAQHGAYGRGAVYTPEDVRGIVKRARLRGVRVVIEIDTPAHVGYAWSWGPSAGLGDLAQCVEAEPWRFYCGEPPCGQLNPKNPHVYDLLEKIYAEIIELTGVNDVFHLGGDEASAWCWAQHFNRSDPMELWLEFTQRALHALVRANGGRAPDLTLLWSSDLTTDRYFERLRNMNLTVQIWGLSQWETSKEVLYAGFRSVISHVDAWYFDCGFGSWRDSSEGHCLPYHTWKRVYDHRLQEGWKIEGGEACQWSEQVGPGGLEARVWPRAAALAERLWADRAGGAGGAGPDVSLRLDTQRARLAARGVRAAPLWSRWCSQNPHACN